MRQNPIKLSVKEKESLEGFLNHEKDKLKVLKIKVILFRNNNMPIKDIIKETGLSKRTIINYTNAYLKNTRFFHSKSNRCKSILEIKNVKEIFPITAPPLSYNEAQTRIKERYDIVLSTTQIRNYLNKNGIYTSGSNHKLTYNKKRKLDKYTKESKNR